MRDSGYGQGRALSWTWKLILANLSFFILIAIDNFYGKGSLEKYLELSTDGLSHGYLWQLVSFQFLHANGTHFLLNMVGLYFCGTAVENLLGSRRLLQLYLLSGALGGLLQAVLGFLVPKYFGYPVVGASAGVFGLLAAYAILEPDQMFLVMLVIPVKARYLLWGSAGIALFFTLVPDSGVAHAAHLGGILTGVGFIHYVVRGGWTFNLPRLRSVKQRPKVLTATVSKTSVWPQPKATEEELPSGEFISREVDPILDKISAHGIQSLTERERRILEAARARMAKR